MTCFRRSVLLRSRALEVKGLQLASCCQAAKMRMTGSTSCYRRRTFGLPLQRGVLSQRKSQHRYSAKSGEGCRPSICGWRSSYGGGCWLTECTSKHPLTGKSKEELDALLFDRAARRNRTDPYEEKKYRGARIKEVQEWWKTCQDWMAHYKTHSEPFVYDIKKLLKALSDKETVAQSEVDAFMENCAKRWQTREGTYQLKRRRLPDVRDSPEYPGADIDMADI